MKRIKESRLLTGAAILLLCMSCNDSLDREDKYSTSELPLVLTQETAGLSAKAKPITEISTFKFLAWNNSESDHKAFVSEYREVTAESGSFSTDILWDSPFNKNFFAYSCGKATELPEGFEVSSVDYQSQLLTCTEIPLYGTLNDIVLGAYSGTGTVSNGTRIAALKFQHPFTSLKAIKGEIADDISTIKSITIKGVYKSGKVSQSFDDSGNPVIGDWTPLEGESFETGNLVLDMVSSSFPNGFPVNYVEEGEEFPIGILPLIPQSGTDLNVEMVVSTTGGIDKSVQGTLYSINWEAGKTNGIIINLNEDSNSLKFTSTVSKWEIVEKGEKIAGDLNGYVQLWDDGPYWATCNLGANNPWEYGDYYVWGAVEPIHKPIDYENTQKVIEESSGGGYYNFAHEFLDWPLDYTADRYPAPGQLDLSKGFDICNMPYSISNGVIFTEDFSLNITKYTGNDNLVTETPDHRYSLEPEDDPAFYKSRGLLRLPNKEDIEGLLDPQKCVWKWTGNYMDSDIAGTIVYKKKASDDYNVATDIHIFIPAAGYSNKIIEEEGGAISERGMGVYFMTDYIDNWRLIIKSSPEIVTLFKLIHYLFPFIPELEEKEETVDIFSSLLYVGIRYEYNDSEADIPMKWPGVRPWAIPVRPVLNN